MNPEYAKMVSDFDQAGANLGHFAQMLGAYHGHLCTSGFQRDEALILVKELQMILFSHAFNFAPKPTVEEDEE